MMHGERYWRRKRGDLEPSTPRYDRKMFDWLSFLVLTLAQDKGDAAEAVCRTGE
jgi:hypothetical protein